MGAADAPRGQEERTVVRSGNLAAIALGLIAATLTQAEEIRGCTGTETEIAGALQRNIAMLAAGRLPQPGDDAACDTEAAVTIHNVIEANATEAADRAISCAQVVNANGGNGIRQFMGLVRCLLSEGGGEEPPRQFAERIVEIRGEGGRQLSGRTGLLVGEDGEETQFETDALGQIVLERGQPLAREVRIMIDPDPANVQRELVKAVNALVERGFGTAANPDWIVVKEVGQEGTAARIGDLAEVLGGARVCRAPCRDEESDDTTLGALAGQQIQIDTQTTRVWTRPGAKVEFEELARLYCTPGRIEVDGTRPFEGRTLTPGEECREYMGESDAASLTRQETVLIVLSHGSGWRGRRTSWAGAITQHLHDLLQVLDEGIGQGVRTYVALSGRTRGRGSELEILAEIDLADPGERRIEAIRRIYRRLDTLETRPSPQREVQEAKQAMRQHLGHVFGLRSAVVFVANPEGAESCTDADWTARIPLVIAWGGGGARPACGHVVERDGTRGEWMQQIGAAMVAAAERSGGSGQ